MKTIAQLLRDAYAQGIARIDAQMLLLHACGQSRFQRSWLLAHDTDIPDSAQLARWQQYMQRRQQGEPVAYITGQKAFYGLELAVDCRVLDPRADTETLVDWALALLDGQAVLDVADLGTGSGAIALALASQRPQWRITATDASHDALDVATHNAQQLQLPVEFIYSRPAHPGPDGGLLSHTSSQTQAISGTNHGIQQKNIPLQQQHPDSPDTIFPTGNDLEMTYIPNWYACLKGRQFHAIISNPPYIAVGDDHLNMLTHEPQSALSSGPDGLDDIRQIIAGAPLHLHAGGWLILEHGYDQAQVVQCLLRTVGFEHIQGQQDLAGITRCSAGQWSGVYPTI